MVKPFVWVVLTIAVLVVVFAVFSAVLLVLTHVFLRRHKMRVDLAENNGQETDAQRMYLLSF